MQKKQTAPPELMAPAGSFAALRAAVRAGADSVYFGVGDLNMRARAAEPFTREDLPEILRVCKKTGTKTYLALNTIVYDEDLERMRALCLDAKEQGLSAVIASDPAAMLYARELGMEVHLSTQANISNSEAVRFYSRWADVVVLARELTLKQIEEISAQIRRQGIRGPSGNPVRIELFVHGALCLAVAGKCAMSLAQTGHSANRGDCFQICRRKFRVVDEETGDEMVVDNPYILSPRDLCTIGILDKLTESGASLFKIEGRGRAPDYVATVTEVYREALDAVWKKTYTAKRIGDWTRRLESVFNRGFRQGGYYLGKPMEMWSGAYGSVATHQKFLCGPVVNYFPRIRVAELDVRHEGLTTGDRAVVIGPTTGALGFTIDSIFMNDQPVDHADKGTRVTLRVPDRVRRNDKLYLIRARRDWQS
ncbi:MAG TPA: U32 family peptidase [bacterium]|nr:U32 family peptidase [bacterium]